jgi:hypothetical protein
MPKHKPPDVDAQAQPIPMPDSPWRNDSCGRCYEDGPTVPANCAERPEALAGQPIGQYHCPDCGAMVLAGWPHPPLCQRCHDRQHPGFDPPADTA